MAVTLIIDCTLGKIQPTCLKSELPGIANYLINEDLPAWLPIGNNSTSFPQTPTDFGMTDKKSAEEKERANNDCG